MPNLFLTNLKPSGIIPTLYKSGLILKVQIFDNYTFDIDRMLDFIVLRSYNASLRPILLRDSAVNIGHKYCLLTTAVVAYCVRDKNVAYDVG